MDNTTVIGILFALLLRWVVSLHSYSGQSQPPMYGDYEAQRHWMEITVNLPANKWYQNSTENDLNYWGLDYPPLTAYHSYLMGKISKWLDNDSVELFKSRGYEQYHHKIFMRSTVCITDMMLYISALFYYWDCSLNSALKSTNLFRCLLAPAIILIDYGHFQYNSVPLGLLIWTVIFFQKQRSVLAAFLFCLSLNYKQISLYYSLPIFFYMLKQCYDQKTFLRMVLKLLSFALTVIITFAILWIPYLSNVESIIQVISRIFPFNRGIYEDKVANFWYCLSILVKVKTLFPQNLLASLCGVVTIIFSLPVCYFIFRKNTFEMLKYSLVNVSMIFFLFSFQVHEKTILFVNTPLLLLSDLHPFATMWFSIIASFSLQPLLLKDNLSIPYFAVTIIYLAICFNNIKNDSRLINIMFVASMLGCLLLSVSSLTIKAPERYPHLHILLNCVYSFIHFALFGLYFVYKQYSLFIHDDRTFTNVKAKLKKK